MATPLSQTFDYGISLEDLRKRRALEQQNTGQPVQPLPAAQPPAAPVYDPAAARAASDAKSKELDQQTSGLFNTYRQRAQQEGQVAKQTQGDALKRRFAAIGNLNSGAYIKAAGLQDQDIDKNIQKSVQDVDLQEAQMKVAGSEAEKNRLMQREAQDLQSSQFNKQFDLQLQQFKQSQAADRLNALTALSGLSDEALRTASGLSTDQFSGSGLFQGGKDLAIQAALKKYGY